MLTVVAALVESGGRLLVCQRRRGDAFALMWEFPGGKLQPGEAPMEALRRELREELGVEATIGPEVYRTRHRYAEMNEPIELIFFAAQVDPRAVENLAFEQIEWREAAALSDLNFLPGDRELIHRLVQGTLRLP